MTRLEELTLNLADDVLSDFEGRELQTLLKESEQAGQVHTRILQIEAGLRASRKNLDLASPIMARLRAQMADSITRGVMSEIKAQPMPDRGWQGVPRKRMKSLAAKILPFTFSIRRNRAVVADDLRRRVSGRLSASSPRRLQYERAAKPALFALAACITLVAGVWMFGPTMGEPALAEVQGVGLSLERAGQSIAAVAGTRLQSGDVLRAPSNVTAVIGFAPENTRVTLQPGTDFKLASMSRGKRFVLGAGKIEASVARQQPWKPMIFSTAQAEARVLGTKFTLTATTNATRLEVSEGKVKLTRTSDDTAVNVGAGHYAVVASNYALATQPLPGKVLREVWLDLPGDSLQDLRYHARYPNAPSGHDFPPSFETRTNWPSAFGTRTRAYLLPPVTGDYEFSISGNGQITLWLSPDDDPVGRVKIGQIAFTRNRPGDTGPEQTRSQLESDPIPLEAGRGYYIEVVHKFGTGEDRLTVTWKRPDGTKESIPSEFLARFKMNAKDTKR